jgi:hypothetical protein
MPVLALPNPDMKPAAIAARIRAEPQSVARLLACAEGGLTTSRAAFVVSHVGANAVDSVRIDGERFESRILSRNLASVGRVFPFVISLGAAMEGLIDGTDDLLEKYILDEIGNAALKLARREFERHLRRQYAVDKMAFMAPGSLKDWPIEQQQGLFALLGDRPAAIGATLTDSCLMLPRKTVSGIYFPSETTFMSCQLCPRAGCDHRKAPFSEAKARSFGV